MIDSEEKVKLKKRRLLILVDSLRLMTLLYCHHPSVISPPLLFVTTVFLVATPSFTGMRMVLILTPSIFF